MINIPHIYSKIFSQYNDYLRNELINCQTILDIGCSGQSPLREFSYSYSVGVDLYKNYINESKRSRIHSDYVHADARQIQFKEKSFDAVLALDILEHMTKKDGSKLIDNMELWARKKIILFTTNGFVSQQEYDGNKLQRHVSGWNLSDLKAKGYQVYGINGLYLLMGHRGSPKYKPKFLWKVVSDFTQKFTYNMPENAFQFLCIKEKPHSSKT